MAVGVVVWGGGGGGGGGSGGRETRLLLIRLFVSFHGGGRVFLESGRASGFLGTMAMLGGDGPHAIWLVGGTKKFI